MMARHSANGRFDDFVVELNELNERMKRKKFNLLDNSNNHD